MNHKIGDVCTFKYPFNNSLPNFKEATIYSEKYKYSGSSYVNRNIVEVIDYKTKTEENDYKYIVRYEDKNGRISYVMLKGIDLVLLETPKKESANKLINNKQTKKEEENEIFRSVQSEGQRCPSAGRVGLPSSGDEVILRNVSSPRPSRLI